MTLRRIKPIRPEPVATPQCSVTFDEGGFQPHYRKRRLARCEAMGWDPAKCTKPSSYEIDGRFLCTQHAGQVALRILTEGQRP